MYAGTLFIGNYNDYQNEILPCTLISFGTTICPCRPIISLPLTTDYFYVSQNELCERVTCPVAPPESSCHHPGMLDGYLRDSKCISCPACLDSREQ